MSADDLIRAETDAHHARARLAITERQAVAYAERNRLARIEAIVADLPDRLDPAGLARARATLERAVAAWVQPCATYARAHGAAWAELSGAGPLPRGVAVDVSGIHAGGVTYRQAPTQRAISAASRAAIQEHFPRHAIRLDEPQD